jgi:hypothetical protein
LKRNKEGVFFLFCWVEKWMEVPGNSVRADRCGEGKIERAKDAALVESQTFISQEPFSR